MIGQTISHYRIIELVGAGGMGLVYRARDEHLERDVALKILPSGALADEKARQRFRREALTLSRLSHPNIAQVYDFDSQDGTDFLVMELVPGTSLDLVLAKGPLAESKVASLGAQLADGLTAASQRNIIHRDLKPANLILTPDGHLKILDFGLSRILPGESDATLSQTTDTAGTLPYMAPEQLRGLPADVRTDVYSAGAVLYEMATGRRPHPDQGAQVVEAILNREPELPSHLNPRVSPALELAIMKALDKEPARRYQSARELKIDLERVAAGSSRIRRSSTRRVHWKWPSVALALLLIGATAAWLIYRHHEVESQNTHSIAVLPLENLSRDPDQDYFADGMTEELITDLSQISALKVISRTSVMRYKNVRKPMPEIARELNVDSVIEGSVERSGNRVRITAQLIHAPTDAHLWAKSYERNLGDVLALQDEVAGAIAHEIGIKLTPTEQVRLGTTRAVNPEAYEAYLRGLYHVDKRTDQDLEIGVTYFRQAIAKDPDYAPAYSGLAAAYALRASLLYMSVPPMEVMPQAKTAALRAVQLNTKLNANPAEAHAVLAYIEMTYDWDWAKSEQDFKEAIELSPNYAQAHHWYALYLAIMGRPEESIREMKRACELDPLSPIIQTNLGWMLFYAGRYDEAIPQFGKVLELNPDFFVTHWELGLAYEQKGMYGDARSEFQKARTLSPDNSVILASLGSVDAALGHKDESRMVVTQLTQLSKQKFVSPYIIAELHAVLGENNEAFKFLQQAYDQRDNWLIILRVDPRLRTLCSDGRFQNLLTRINLPKTSDLDPRGAVPRP